MKVFPFNDMPVLIDLDEVPPSQRLHVYATMCALEDMTADEALPILQRVADTLPLPSGKRIYPETIKFLYQIVQGTILILRDMNYLPVNVGAEYE